MTSMHPLSRRAALAALGACALAGLGGCAPTNAPAVQAAGPTSAFHIASIAVNTAPLLAQLGNPTAQWAQDSLPGQLAQVLAADMAPGDPGGATLSVRVDSIYLGGGGPTDPDTMRGVATLSRGAGGPPRQTSVHVVLTYIPSPTDQALVEQAFRGRVQALSQAFAYRLKRKWGL